LANFTAVGKFQSLCIYQVRKLPRLKNAIYEHLTVLLLGKIIVVRYAIIISDSNEVSKCISRSNTCKVHMLIPTHFHVSIAIDFISANISYIISNAMISYKFV
jgi:hypothetical protein